MSKKERIINSLKNKSLIKIIAGIKNYNKQKVLDIVTAAEFGGANAVDICDDLDIINAVKGTIELPVFVSSINAEKLISAQNAGADVLEIGNYESFYADGSNFGKEEILEISKKVKTQIDPEKLLCVTIPGFLSVSEQIKLSKDLMEIGVDILQTEGYMPDQPESNRKDVSYLEVIKAASTLTNTMEIKKAIPEALVLTASGITPSTASLAIAMGASGIGVGTFISSQQYQAGMVEKVKELVESINSFSPNYIEVEKVFNLLHS